MINWKTTLGGACAAAGIALAGVAHISQLQSVDLPSTFIVHCEEAGVIITIAGTFFTALFARDRKVSDEQSGAGRQPPVEPHKTP